MHTVQMCAMKHICGTLSLHKNGSNSPDKFWKNTYVGVSNIKLGTVTIVKGKISYDYPNGTPKSSNENQGFELY